MKHIKSTLVLILVLVASLLVSCGGSVAKAPPTYTPEKIAEITTIAKQVNIARDRMGELEKAIEEQNWIDVRSFIHGPLGSLRRDMGYVTRALLPQDQEQASQLTKDLFAHLEDIDAAAKEKNYSVAMSEYRDAIKDFDAFLALVPKAPEVSTEETEEVEVTSETDSLEEAT
ncbi:MAG: photosystem II protein PsbQ [Cyanobacteria bacterium J083]|nr:MAG: photosystem II protein PsbQ [Cyanobacteria bacterium J083]